MDFLLYCFLVMVGWSVYPANVAAFGVGTVVNVLFVRAYVFPNPRFSLGIDLALTFGSNGGMFLLGMGLLWLMVEQASWNPYLAKILANGATFVLNYVVRATFFRKK